MDYGDIEGMEFPEEPGEETEDLQCMLFCCFCGTTCLA